jgi:hypothetical protein
MCPQNAYHSQGEPVDAVPQPPETVPSTPASKCIMQINDKDVLGTYKGLKWDLDMREQDGESGDNMVQQPAAWGCQKFPNPWATPLPLYVIIFFLLHENWLFL